MGMLLHLNDTSLDIHLRALSLMATHGISYRSMENEPLDRANA